MVSPFALLRWIRQHRRGPGSCTKKCLGLTALVNNAGFEVFGEFRDSDLTTQRSMMRLNMDALVSLTGLFFPGFAGIPSRS